MKSEFLMAAIVAGLTLTAVDASAQGRGPAADRPDFATLDSDGDGLLTPEELQAQAAARFADADTDGDGAVSAEELAAVIAARATDRAETMVARMLARLDANDDGMLQEDEMQPRGGDRAARMFDRADRDGDGAISEEEFDDLRARGRDRRGRDRGDRHHGRG